MSIAAVLASLFEDHLLPSTAEELTLKTCLHLKKAQELLQMLVQLLVATLLKTFTAKRTPRLEIPKS